MMIHLVFQAYEFFAEFLYGDGLLLFLLLYSIVCVLFTLKTKYAMIFIIPITILLMLDYIALGTDLGLYATIILFIDLSFSVVYYFSQRN